MSERLPLRQRHTNSHQHAPAVLPHRWLRVNNLRGGKTSKPSEETRIPASGFERAAWARGLSLGFWSVHLHTRRPGWAPPRKKPKIKITQKIVSYVAICVGKTRTNDEKKLLLTLGYTARNRQLHHAGLSLHPFARSGGLPVHTSARGGVRWGMPRARPGDAAAAAERDNKGEGSEIELWYTRPQRRGPRVTLTLLLVGLFFFFFLPSAACAPFALIPSTFDLLSRLLQLFRRRRVCRPRRRHLSSAAL